MEALEVLEEAGSILSEHATVPIAFEVRARLDVEALGRGELVELEVVRFWKDYDALEPIGSMVASLAPDSWLLLAAHEEGERLGGLVLVFEMPAPGMATVLDLRVHPSARRRGAGRALMKAAIAHCARRSVRELWVETQDINVAACRFYWAMGFELAEINPAAYPQELEEVQILWQLAI